ncbi:MAG: hypothetical protein PVI23_14220 [Maricaulaceae bacterium]|jgi:hypothetical protein
MKHIPLILVAIAVIIATAQAFWTLRSRDDHIEAIVAGRQLDACAEIGAAAADFAYRAQAAQASFTEENFRALREGPRALARASYLAAYLLPEEASQQSAILRDLSQRIVGALGDRDETRVAELLREFDGVNLDVQQSCRQVIQGSRFAL